MCALRREKGGSRWERERQRRWARERGRARAWGQATFLIAYTRRGLHLAAPSRPVVRLAVPSASPRDCGKRISRSSSSAWLTFYFTCCNAPPSHFPIHVLGAGFERKLLSSRSRTPVKGLMILQQPCTALQRVHTIPPVWTIVLLVGDASSRRRSARICLLRQALRSRPLDVAVAFIRVDANRLDPWRTAPRAGGTRFPMCMNRVTAASACMPSPSSNQNAALRRTS